ncbi:MAG TPA: electron transfer flavoprotein subunit alpha/FixB family protein [Longimicrobiales bacterium]|nr:electron transfer flavoprotein subunit alpha/FixB family protein [Longimicrobiales bacterium]
MPNVLAIAEQKNGSLRRIAREVTTAARTLAEALGVEAHALVLGDAEDAAELGRYGAEKVFVAGGEALESYQPEAYVPVAQRFLEGRDYPVILIGASSPGKDLAPRLAARLGVPLASDATALEIEDGAVVVTRPIYAGKAFATVVLRAQPALVTLRTNNFTPEERPAAGAVEQVEAGVDPSSFRVKVRETQGAGGERPDVGEAPIVVAGGRGLQDPANWSVLEELRDALGAQAALGASRAVVDAGWRPHGEQVGQTGKTVSPQLYFAVAISGAIQHLAGMRTASTIVAINKDPDAPIFKVADYGIVGDALEVVPRLTEEVKKARQG